MTLNFGILNESEEDMPESALPVVQPDPFDPEHLVALFDKFGAEIVKMEDTVASFIISDDKSNTEAVEMTAQAKGLASTIEKERKKVKEPYLKVVKALDGFANGLGNRLSGVQGTLNNKIQPYLEELAKKRAEEERKAQEIARKEQERLEAGRKKEQGRLAEIARQKAIEEGIPEEAADRLANEAKAMVEDAPLVVAPTPITPEKIETEAGSARLKTTPQGFIVDFKALPDECISARWNEIEKAVMPWVRAQIAAGLRNITGVEVRMVAKIETRTKK
jgi:predicted transcriptional regulator